MVANSCRGLVGLCAALLAFTAAAPTETAGQLTCSQVKLPEHSLQQCSGGTGRVTVVFEAGMQSDSRTWRAVAPGVARIAHVVTYDRAGLGESEAGPLPRTSLQIARELAALLDAMGIDGPLLLVGHSAGGWHVRTFASEFPDRVVGLVLIDSPHEDFEGRRNAVLSEAERAERQTSLQTMRSSLARGHRLEYEGLEQTPRSLWKRPLPNVPLVVLAAELHDWIPARSAEAQNDAWHELQRNLAQLTSQGRLEVVRSGHNIQLERPEAVVRVIQEMVERIGLSQARKNGR